MDNEIDSLQDKITKTVLFFVIYTFIFIFFVSTIKFTFPFVIAMIFALILRIPTKYLMKKLKLSSWLSSLISTIIFFTIFIVIAVVGLASLTGELISLTKSLQELVTNNSSSYFSELGLFFETILKKINLDPSVWDTITTTFNQSINKFLSVGVDGFKSLLSIILSFFGYVPYIGMTIAFTILSTYFFTESLCRENSSNFIYILNKTNKKISHAIKHGKKMLLNYISAYMFLIFVSMFITFIGFSIFNIDYALLLSILSGLLDLLPIVGMACVYIPLAIYFFFNGNIFVSVGLIILYILVSVTRQLLEPKIMSSSLGISPIATLVSIFVGLQLDGLRGMIFCIFMVISYKVLKTVEII
ncbi:sporulation integral membrane protein YtvI [Clostridium carnis]